MSETVSIEVLKERFPIENVDPHGEVLVIPRRFFQIGWELELEAQGHKVFVGAHKGESKFLVRMNKIPMLNAESLHAREDVITVANPDPKTDFNKDEREFKEIPISLIESSTKPSREVFEDIGSLAATIKRHGLLEPILVKKKFTGYGFEVVIGERRFRACQQAGIGKIPCIVVDGVDDEQVLEMQLVENVHRKDLKFFEEVQILEALRDRFKLSHEEIAIKTGLSHGTVQNYLTIARLPEEYLRMIGRDSHHTTQLTITKALLLAQANLPADQLKETVEFIKRKGLSRAQLARKLAKERPSKIMRVEGSKHYWRELTKRLKEYASYWSDYCRLKEWETVDHYHLQLNVSLPKDLREGGGPVDERVD